ncbi:MAG: hypothetical protein ACT4NJ_00740 [Nitrosopumilaceae archaeon]
MELVKSIKRVFSKSFCSICLSDGILSKFDRLEVCSSCLEKIKEIESDEPVKISKEQTAGGIKDEL